MNRELRQTKSNSRMMPPYNKPKKDSDKKDAPAAYAEDVDQLAD